MKIQIASDLHLEYNEKHSPTVVLEKYLEPTDAELLILAGDIGSLYNICQLKQLLGQACSKYSKVIYVAGNHEYYTEKNHDELSFKELYQRLRSLEQDFSNLKILEKEYVIIDGYCIAGCTMWSDCKVKIPPYIVRIRDINYLYRKLYSESVTFIKSTIEMCQKRGYKLLMVTHHPPSYDCINPIQNGDAYISLYASALDHLLKSQSVDAWIHGHTHYNQDFYTIDGTRVLSNQYGKPRDCIKNYEKKFVVEI